MKKITYYKKNTDILNECKKFYQKLYNKQKTCETTQKQLLQNINSKISNNQNQTRTKEIETSEIKLAIQNMENDKSPGIDGIPVKEFYEILKKDLQDTFNNILFNLEITPKTWNQAIITLIPKHTENLHYLKY